jgi:hypothetical protein
MLFEQFLLWSSTNIGPLNPWSPSLKIVSKREQYTEWFGSWVNWMKILFKHH